MFLESILNFHQWLSDFTWMEWIQQASGIEIALKFLILYFAFFWFALVIWVARDAINRSNSILFHVISILLNIFLPIFWLIIYLLVRPPRTLMDKYYEDLEFQSLSNETKDFCHNCNSVVGEDYKFCWECWEDLICKCNSCKKDYFIRYRVCPFCGHKKGKKIKEEKVEPKKDEKKTDKKKKS